MRLLLDEMIGPAVAAALREQGHDVMASTEEFGLRTLPDDGVLELARELDRVVVTRNVSDFARLDQQWRAESRRHPGLVLVTERAFPQTRNLVRSLVRALLQAAQTGALPSPGTVAYLVPVKH